VSVFYIFLYFLYFLFFFKFLKNYKFATCQVDTVPCSSDSATCHYYARCHFPILNLVLVF